MMSPSSVVSAPVVSYQSLVMQETQLADALAAVESWRGRHSQEVKEKSQLEVEITVLNK